MSNNNNIDDDEQLAKAKSILQANQKVFLRHTHSPGYLHAKAQWSGEYHLATVQQSYDASTNKFKVLWKRGSGNGGLTSAAKTVTYTLDSPMQVLVDVNYANMTVQIEDDDNGNTHTARIVNLCDGLSGSCGGGSGSSEGGIVRRQGEVRIKWDTGYEQLVNVSQVSFGCRRRRKRRTTVAKQRGGVAKTRKKWIAKNSPKKKVDESIEIVTIDSSSSEEEDDSSSSQEEDDVRSYRVNSECHSEENEEASSALPKRGLGVMMHGFCRSVPQMKDDPHQTIEVIQNMLNKAKECAKNSEELRETLVDAHMLMQEILFNLDERTKFVNAPNSNKAPSSMPENDGNKSHIIRLAKHFGLSQHQMDILFKRLDVDDGYYSIDDAIPKITEMKNNNASSTLEDSDEEDENDADIVTADNGQKEKQLELLGSRVKTVFEDGREYEGTISTVHYRVKYDDNDTETFVSEAEAFENLACNDNIALNGSSSCDGIRCSALEIFSGCSILSTLCKRKGMTVISIDNDPNSNATVKDDFSSDYVKSILATQSFDYIHASPVCSTYSLLAGGKHRDKDNYNKTLQSHEADGILTLLYFFIAKQLETNNSSTVTIENPRGWMKKGNIMKELFEVELGFKRFEIKYCQFGRADQKPTNIWTNDLKLGDILETVGGKCDCPLPHEESVKGRNGSSNRDKNFAALPLKLCQLITTYVHSKHTQLNFEKLAPNAPR